MKMVEYEVIEIDHTKQKGQNVNYLDRLRLKSISSVGLFCFLVFYSYKLAVFLISSLLIRIIIVFKTNSVLLNYLKD